MPHHIVKRDCHNTRKTSKLRKMRKALGKGMFMSYHITLNIRLGITQIDIPHKTVPPSHLYRARSSSLSLDLLAPKEHAKQGKPKIDGPLRPG